MDTLEREGYRINIDFSKMMTQLESEPRETWGARYEIISRVAFLIGVSDFVFEKEHEPPKLEIYNMLKKDKRARIIRNLCKLRTQFEIYFLKICRGIQQENRSMMAMPEYLPTELFEGLREDGVDIYVHLHEPSPFLYNINRLIKERIDNCRSLFPDWISWNYLRDIFIMPDGLTEEGTKAAAQFYYENQSFYPYKQYMNWPAKDSGNILYNDKFFVTQLYEWNGDEFTELSYVSDVSDRTKTDIYKFIESSEKTVFVVDCENSDPYALCAAIRNLDPERLQKIEKIILYDDVHAASAWETLSSYVDIPVEYIMIERLKDNKSLADIKVAARTCQEFYQNGVDSFILVSSDSDYWGLIEELPNAKFLVMIEHVKSGYALKDALISHEIPFCYIDDFYTGDGNEIKTDSLKREFSRVFKDALELNLNQVLNEVLIRTRINMNEREKKDFLKKYVKTALSLEVSEAGDVRLEYRPKK